MDSRFDTVFKTACAELKRNGNRMLGLPIPIRTVLLVHNAQGIIGNGGLKYLFEADFPEKPPYSHFVEAYRRIGAQEEADALEVAVARFPFMAPHLRCDQRNAFIDEHSTEDAGIFDDLDDKLVPSDSVCEKLDRYIDDHWDEFEL